MPLSFSSLSRLCLVFLMVVAQRINKSNSSNGTDKNRSPSPKMKRATLMRQVGPLRLPCASCGQTHLTEARLLVPLPVPRSFLGGLYVCGLPLCVLLISLITSHDSFSFLLRPTGFASLPVVLSLNKTCCRWVSRWVTRWVTRWGPL